MPHINSFKFGEITVDGKKYHQVLIIGNTVVERDYEKLKELFNTSHKIGDWEEEGLIKENPEKIFIGTGTEGMLEVSGEFKEKIKNTGIELIVGVTPKIIDLFNKELKTDKRINALIHTTC